MERMLEAKYQELRLMLGGLTISPGELRACLALVDECEQYSGSASADKENCRPVAARNNADLSVSCISNASTIVLSPTTKGHDDTSLTSLGECGDVLGDLPATTAKDGLSSPGLLQFGVSPSPSLTANAVKRRRRAHKNDAESKSDAETLCAGSPIPCTQVSLEGEGREQEGEGEKESPEREEGERVEMEEEKDVGERGEAEIAAEPEAEMAISEVEEAEKEADVVEIATAAAVAASEEPRHQDGEKMKEEEEEEEEKAQVMLAEEQSQHQQQQQQQQQEEAAGHAVFPAEPAVDAAEYKMHYAEEEEVPAPRSASEKPEKRRNPRRQSVSGKRLGEGAKERNRAAILSHSSSLSSSSSSSATAMETEEEAAVKPESSPAPAPTSPPAPALPPPSPQAAADSTAIAFAAPPTLLALPAHAQSLAETAVASIPASPPAAHALALALAAAVVDTLPATEAATLRSLALTTHALCVLLLPPAALNCQAPALDAPPAPKRRRVAFLTTAGCSSSPPNDRRPESFLNTMADAQRLHQALGLCDELATLPLPALLPADGAAEGGGSPLVEALGRVAGLPGLDREAAGLASIIREELQPRSDAQQGDEAEAPVPSPLRFRLSWMLSAVIRYNLRWLLDVPPPSISAPRDGGDYLAIADVRSSVHTLIKVTPAPPVQPYVSLYTPSPPAAASAKRPKPAAVDHCHVDTADVPLSALVTYALRQMDLERRFLARRAAPGAAADAEACREAAWRAVLGSAEVAGSLLAEVEALQVLLAAASGRAFLSALLALPCMAATPGARAGTATDPWSSIATSAALLQSLRADERHLTLLAAGPAALLASLREASADRPATSGSSSSSEACLASTAAARLDEIRRTLGTKRGGGPATSAAAKERDSVRWELTQASLIFDFPSLSQSDAPLEGER